MVRIANLLEVSRSGYTPGRPGSGRLGAPRILADLRAGGEVVSRKTVANLMRANDTVDQPQAVTAGPHHHRPQPAPYPGPGRAPLRPRRPERGVDPDITHLATGQGWLYLCAVRNGHSRRVIGYAFSESLPTDVAERCAER